jgi:hypothetical protein
LDRVGAFNFWRDVDQPQLDPLDTRHVSLPLPRLIARPAARIKSAPQPND